MQLGEGEELIGEWYFKKGGDVANVSKLTNRRLVVIYGNAEESYPLSKITAVRIIFNRSWLMLIFGGILALFSLAGFGEGGLALFIALPIGAGLVYLGWIGKTRLTISMMGGEKEYIVRGKGSSLKECMEAVNSRLS